MIKQNMHSICVYGFAHIHPDCIQFCFIWMLAASCFHLSKCFYFHLRSMRLYDHIKNCIIILLLSVVDWQCLSSHTSMSTMFSAKQFFFYFVFILWNRWPHGVIFIKTIQSRRKKITAYAESCMSEHVNIAIFQHYMNCTWNIGLWQRCFFSVVFILKYYIFAFVIFY